MGAIVSTLTEPGSMCVVDPSRFTIQSIHVRNLDGRSLLRLSTAPDGRSIVPVRERNAPMIEFVQDIEPQTVTPILLKLSNESGLVFTFSIAINKAQDEAVSLDGLTYLSSSSSTALNSMLARNLYSDPNIQNRENVIFIGDYASANHEKIQLEWNWTWRPSSDIDFQFNGWRNTCCFAEYSKRDHQLHLLAQFSFWVQESSRSIWAVPPSPGEINLAQFRTHSSGDDSPEHELLPSAPISIVGDTHDMSSDFKPMPVIPFHSTAPATHGTPAAAVAGVPRPGPEDLSQPEDGPLFRATVSSLERKTSTLKASVKRLLKRAIHTYDSQRTFCESYSAFVETLSEASADLNSFQPIVDHYFKTVGQDLVRFEQQSCMKLHAHIIEPLKKLYEVDIKAADSKKRDFDDESREYYAWLGRYLSMKQEATGKKKTESDSKYQDKRKSFELKRFDYYSYIQDLHGGRREQEVSYQFSLYAEATLKDFLKICKSIQFCKPQIDSMVLSMRESHDAWAIRRTEREERRRALEISAMPEPIMASTNIYADNSKKLTHVRTLSRDQLPQLNTTLSGVNGTSLTPTGQQRIKGIRDLKERDDAADMRRRKEGLLWAMSKPYSDPRNINKPGGWHKFWVVLAGGQLYEYSNWKQSLELHGEPINLKMASVREARATERRFCFEVITPQYRRVYQATSEDDMQSWITIISNAIASTIEGTGSVRSLQTPLDANGIGNAATAPSVKIQSTPTSKRVVSNANDDNDDDYTLFPLSPASSTEQSTAPHDASTLIQRLRDADPTNGTCADCGATSKVEWVSINLMTILCIECSGLHRSLGTHISKVRSLTLDTVSFTPDLVDALVAVGNGNANAIWEATPAADEAKRQLQQQLASNQQQQSAQQQGTPTPHSSGSSVSSRQCRLEFITKKYVERAYVMAVPQPNVALRSAVKAQNIIDVLRALASNADTNMIVLSSAASIASASSSTSSTSSIAPVYPIFLTALVYAPKDARTFPIAELLVQNGTRVPSDVPAEIRLPPAAREFFERKIGKKPTDQFAGYSTSDCSPSSASSISENAKAPGSPLHMLEQGNRFQRKISSGASRLL